MKEKELYYRYEHKTENSDTFVLKEKMLYGAGLNCFKNKEDATKSTTFSIIFESLDFYKET